MTPARGPAWIGAAEWLFNASLYLYPSRLRSEHGDEMRQVFRDRCQEVADGTRGGLRFALQMIPDTLSSAASSQWDDGIGERRTWHYFAMAILLLASGWFLFQDTLSNHFLGAVKRAGYWYDNAAADRQLSEQERQVRSLAEPLAREASAESQVLAGFLYRGLYEGRVNLYLWGQGEDSGSIEGYYQSPESYRASTDGESAARALSAAAAERVPAWLAAAAAKACVAEAGCDRQRAITRLVELEPDNAYGWSLAFKQAGIAGDEGAAQAALSRMASAARYDDHLGEIRAAVVGASHRLLPGDDEARAQVAKLLADSYWVVESSDYSESIGRKCSIRNFGPGTWLHQHPGSEDDCLRVAGLLARSGSPFHAFVGSSLLAQRDASAEAKAAAEQAFKFYLKSGQIGFDRNKTGYGGNFWTSSQWNAWADFLEPGMSEAESVRRWQAREQD